MYKYLLALLVILLIVSSAFSVGKAKQTNQLSLSKENTIVLADEVNSMTVAKVLQQAVELDKELPEGECIILALNTPGGSIVAGQELIDGLKGLGRCVNTLVIFAASMGFQIAQNLDTRYVLPNGEYMSHRAFASGGFGGEFGGKEPSQLSNRYNSWLEKIKQMDLITVKRTKGKQTLESYQDAYENELWISGQAAVDKGYSDKVVYAKCDDTLSGTTVQQLSFFGLQVDVVFSECPLITGPVDVRMKITTNKGSILTLSEFKQKGGRFDSVCTVAPSLLCSADVTLTEEKLEKMKLDIINKYTNRKKSIIYNYGVF